jgi:hypothetical protein
VPLTTDDITALYRRLAESMVTYFARRTYDPEAAVDLVAETFAAIVRDRRQFRGGGEDARLLRRLRRDLSHRQARTDVDAGRRLAPPADSALPRHVRRNMSIHPAPLVLVAVLALAPAASAQSLDRTIVSVGAGQVTVAPQDRTSNDSIAAAVHDAYAAALPKAVSDARDDAAELAKAAGVSLGELLTISNAPIQAFYGPFFGPQLGTFGPGKFCGNVRRAIVHTDQAGRRRVTGFRTRHTCRVPSSVTRQVTLTFAIAAPPVT